jgi:cytosine/adenosine deaminase-related metal-dependent hydrolase
MKVDLLQKAVHSDPRYLGADKVIEMAVINNRRLAATFFDRPVGVVAAGAYADLILLDYWPTTPLMAANLPWHMLFGVSGGHVHSTIVQGVTLMRGRIACWTAASPRTVAATHRRPGSAITSFGWNRSV